MRMLFVVSCFIVLIACGSEHSESAHEQETVDTNVVLEKGQKITASTFATLSSNLQKAMGKGGVEHALKFCNIEAYPLTDSLSEHYGVEVRRSSHKPRNPSNRADSLELQTIRSYIEQIEKGKELQAKVVTSDKHIFFHAPIRISSQLCLNCHGQPGKDITASNLRLIDSLYPQDRARGFRMGELRGIWSVRFPKDDHNEVSE